MFGKILKDEIKIVEKLERIYPLNKMSFKISLKENIELKKLVKVESEVKKQFK